jgi:hypothetical protein
VVRSDWSLSDCLATPTLLTGDKALPDCDWLATSVVDSNGSDGNIFVLVSDVRRGMLGACWTGQSSAVDEGAAVLDHRPLSNSIRADSFDLSLKLEVMKLNSKFEEISLS